MVESEDITQEGEAHASERKAQTKKSKIVKGKPSDEKVKR